MLMQDWLAQLGSTSIYLNPRCVIRILVFAATLLYPLTRIILFWNAQLQTEGRKDGQTVFCPDRDGPS